MVRGRQLAATLREGVAIRDPAPLELATDVATGRPRQKHVQLGDLGRDALERVDEHVRPLHELRLEPFPQPTPSFWNEPTTNASAGRSSAARAAARRSGVTSGKFSMSIPIAIT